MPTNTTVVLSDSVRTQYMSEYTIGALGARVYDLFAMAPVGRPMVELMKGSSVQMNFLSDLALGVSAISQVADLDPVTFRDATASITPTSRGNAVQDSELLLIQNFLNYDGSAGAKMKKLGKNQMESVEVLASNAAMQGTNIYRSAARASLDAGTTADRLTDTTFARAETRFSTLKVPSFLDARGMRVDSAPGYAALMHPMIYHDLRTSGLIDDVGVYQDKGIILNWALGRVGPFQILVSPHAKTFWGAGADNGSNVNTTLSGAESALDLTVVVASATNIDVGDWLNIGTEETGDTHYPDNERVWVTSVSGTTIGVVGEGDNGGLKFDHVSGTAVRNADSAFTVLFGGATSLAKLYATGYIGDKVYDEGPYGAVVGPIFSGNVQQYAGVGWKFYGGYGRFNEAWLLRGEFSSSLEA